MLYRVGIHMSPVKRICVFEHSVMTNFNCACPAIQRGQRSGFLSEGSSWLTACMSEQRRFWRDCADSQARLNLRCSHRRSVPNSLDAVHMIKFNNHQWKVEVSLYAKQTNFQISSFLYESNMFALGKFWRHVFILKHCLLKLHLKWHLRVFI